MDLADVRLLPAAEATVGSSSPRSLPSDVRRDFAVVFGSNDDGGDDSAFKTTIAETVQ